MGWSHLLVACAFVGIATMSALAQEGQRLKVFHTYQGSVANDKVPEIKTGFIATEADWEKAFQQVFPQEKLSPIDFSKHFLVVTTQNAADPNRATVSIQKDDKGAIRVSTISTLIGFTPSDQTIVRFHEVSREGVTGVHGNDASEKSVVYPLPKSSVTK